MRWRPPYKFPFRRTQGQVNSVGPWHPSLWIWMEICLLTATASVCLSFLVSNLDVCKLEKYEKSGFAKQLFLNKNLGSAEFTDKKNTGSPLCISCARDVCQTQIPVCTLYVLKKSIVLLWLFWICFLFVFIKAYSHGATCMIRFFCTIILKPRKWFSEFEKSCLRAKAKLFQPSVNHHMYRFANVRLIFYKVHSLSSEQVFNWIEKNLFEVQRIDLLLYTKMSVRKH